MKQLILNFGWFRSGGEVRGPLVQRQGGREEGEDRGQEEVAFDTP